VHFYVFSLVCGQLNYNETIYFKHLCQPIVYFFCFFPLRLDGFIYWRYVIVFIPFWIALSIALLFVSSKLVLAIIHRCSHRVLPNHQETSLAEAIIYVFIFIPLTMHAILLVDRLDGDERLSFVVVAIPLWISLFSWLSFSFGAKDGNPLWFGVRRDLCEIILFKCPLLQLYGNNSYKFVPRNSADIVVSLTRKQEPESLLTKPTIAEKDKFIQNLTLQEPD